MNSTQATQPDVNAERVNAEQPPAVVLKQPQVSKLRPPHTKPLTLGQKVADKMAAKVGSWAFLIGQSTVLAGWVGCNLMPGMPHWDESPFILLNLVFSFASAYTAPIVLMSQNRQSEEDRESANHNYQIILQSAQNLELLHEKLDGTYASKLDALTTLLQQQQAAKQPKIVFVPTQIGTDVAAQRNEIVGLTTPKNQRETVFMKVGEGRSIASHLELDEVELVTSK